MMPAFGKPRLEDLEFKDRLSYIVGLLSKKQKQARCRRLTPVIQASQEADIRSHSSKPARQVVCKTLS
jgi:hypothetical protein